MMRMKPERNTSRSSSLSKGVQAGTRDGMAEGWNGGYRLGLSHGIRAQVGEPSVAALPYKVLYVSAGISDPYPALDQAIVDGLSRVVSEVIAISPADSVIAAAQLHSPDLVLVLNAVALPVEEVDKLRSGGFLTAVWFTDDPYYSEWTGQIARHYDIVFTLELNCVPFYQSQGCSRVYYLPFAVNPGFYYPTVVEPAIRSDICFIGTAFWNRVRYIDHLAPYLRKRRTFISGLWWDRLKSYRLLSPSIQLGNWMTPENTARFYNGAKVVINLHRPFDDETNHNGLRIEACSVNPRMFEINGCATMQLVDARSETARWYVPGKEIDVYHSPEELRHKLDYYLNHEDERREIALRGYRRTLEQHTYVHRLRQMMAMIFEGS